jgi:hypothetical protein
MSERQSAFIFYSYGIVAVDKERDSDAIKVTPIEELSMASAKSEEIKATARGNAKPNISRNETSKGPTLANQSVSYNVELPDHQGVSRSGNVTGDIMLVATWTPLCQSNRMTAPDVIEGETVMIFRVADTDEYYWSTMMREPNIRRLETVCYMYGNMPDGINPFDKSSSYWIEVSTHDQYVHFHTAKNNGEPFEYDIKLDTAKGHFILTDNSGNFVELDSPTSMLRATTNEDIEANTKRVVVNASESVTVNTVVCTINATESTTVNTPLATVNSETTIVNASKEVVANTPDFIVNSDTCTLNGKDVVTVNSSQFVINASTLGFNSGSIVMNASSDYSGANDGSQHRGKSEPVTGGGSNGNDETIHMNAKHLRTEILEDTINNCPTVTHVSDNITSTVSEDVITTATNITNEVSANISNTAVKVTTDAAEEITTVTEIEINATNINVTVAADVNTTLGGNSSLTAVDVTTTASGNVTDTVTGNIVASCVDATLTSTGKITATSVDLEVTSTNVVLGADFVTANIVEDLTVNSTNAIVTVTGLTTVTTPEVLLTSETKVEVVTPLFKVDGSIATTGGISAVANIVTAGDCIAAGVTLT